MDGNKFWKFFGRVTLLLSGLFLIFHVLLDNTETDTKISHIHLNETDTKIFPIHLNETETKIFHIQYNETRGCKIGFTVGGDSVMVFSLLFHWIEISRRRMFGANIPEHFGKWCNFVGPLVAALLARFYSLCKSKSSWLFRSNFNVVGEGTVHALLLH